MPGIVALRKDIQFHVRLAGLLEVLKAIAAQRFQALERSLKLNDKFFAALGAMTSGFDLSALKHPFVQGTGPVGVIAVTSDAGLLGGLNQQVILAAVKEYREEPGEIIVIGKRGVPYVRERRLPCREFPGVQDETRRALSEQVRDYAINQVLEGKLGRLTIVYPKALSFTVQRVEVIPALPCQAWLQTDEPGMRGHEGTLLESSISRVLEYLVWAWLGEKLFEVFGHSRLAELAARAVHLEGSLQELRRRKQKLQLRYFRERREIIDRNIRELSAARSLYGKA